MSLRHAILGLALALGACDGCRQSAKQEPDARVRVTLDADSVSVDGVRVAARSAIAKTAPTRLTPLFDELKARREAWKVAHPTQSFPAGADLVLSPVATCIEVENLLRTLAYAGYSHVVIDPGAGAMNVDYRVPMPPPLDEIDASPPLPIQLRFHTDGKVGLSRTCTGVPTIVDASAVPQAVAAVPADVVRFGCDEGVRFSTVKPTLVALRTARSTKLDDAECDLTVDGGVPAHVLALSIGLSSIGGDPFVHRPGTLGPTIVTTQGVDAGLANAALTPRLPTIAACFVDNRPEHREVGIGIFDGDHATIELTIAGDGGVALIDGGAVTGAVALCIGRALASITFPPFDAATAKVTYGFVFKDAAK